VTPRTGRGDPQSFPLPPSIAESGDVRLAASERSGRVIAGRYRLVGRLGKGGHGEVWEADDALTGGGVALKLLGVGVGVQAARVRREVSALRLLRLPGVVRLLDEGVDEGLAFLVMERVEGLPFPGAPRPRPWPMLGETTVALLETLARIHAAGVVHRDLKPANVLVSAEGRPTVLDFGISHFDSPLSDGLTEVGELLGTPAYLAPEQVNGEAVTVRTDLYSLGVMLYEALSGRLPHEGRNLTELMFARLSRSPIPLRDVAPEVSPAIAEIVEQLLAPSPEARPRSAAEVLGMLRGEPLLTAPSLLRLGSDAPVRALIEAATRGRSIDLCGRPGSGRTRCLADAAAALEALGYTPHRTAPGRRAFSSLVPIVGALDDHALTQLDEMTLLVERRLRASLGGAAVLLVDDADRIDQSSAKVIERLRAERVVLRSYPSPTKGAGEPAASVRLEALDEAALGALFAGRERLFHLRSDAAHALWTRTEGVPARVVEEVNAWVRAGLARWAEGRLAIEREAIDRLEGGLHTIIDAAEAAAPLAPHLDDLLSWITLARPSADVALLARVTRQPRWRVEAEVDELLAAGAARRGPEGTLAPSRASRLRESWPGDRLQAAHRALAEALPLGAPGRLLHLVAGDDDAEEQALAIAREARASARRVAQEGRLGLALSSLAEGLRALHHSRISPTPELEALLSLWVEIALADGTPSTIDRVLYELCRVDPGTPAIAQLEQLVRAAIAFGSGGEIGLAAASAVPPFEDPALERRRLNLRLIAARRCSREDEEAALADASAWAARSGAAVAEASLSAWMGRIKYRRGEFAEAAAFHRRSAARETWATNRTGSLLNAASSLLEAFRHEEAEAMAREAFALATRCRHPFFEARAEWVLRAASYRLGRVTAVDHELLDAIAALGTRDLEALACLTEAALAFRLDQRAEAMALAERARAVWASLGDVWGALLARCLELACRRESSLGDAITLAAEAARCPLAGIGIQALGLLQLAAGASAEQLGVDPILLSDKVPRAFWSLRMEVLSVDEVMTQTVITGEDLGGRREHGR
jgi:hypothetical protein